MTSEERTRMNEICTRIQEEKDYDQFATLLREMSDLIARKEERRFKGRPRLIWNRNRPWSTMPAIVNKVIPGGLARDPEKVEIALQDADALFRELRIQNSLTHPEGGSVALKPGARVDVTFEADPADTVRRGVSAT